MSETDPALTRSGVATATSLTAVGMMTMNVLAYAFVLMSSHLLGPGDFGNVSALMSLLLVANVGALALQATGARRIATADDSARERVAHDILISTWRVTAALTVLAAAAVPLIVFGLHTDWWAAIVVALTVAPLTVLGGYIGILQGSARWRALAVTFATVGLGRALLGGLGIVLLDSVTGAMLGVLVGAVLPAVVAWWNCRHVPHRATGRPHGVLREVWHNGHSLLAFFVLTNADVLVARNQFSAVDSGIYAAGSILTKTCLFLPQFVLIVAFPAMARDQDVDADDSAWLRPLGLVVCLGLVAVLGCAVLPDLAVTFVGGDEYAELATYAWLFTISGTCFAAMQMVVYRQIARQARVAVLLWVAATAIGLIGVLLIDSNRALILTVVAIVALAALPVAGVRPVSGPPRASSGRSRR